MPSRFAGDAGERDRLVVIQQLTETKGESHFPVEEWSTLATVFMSKVPVGGRERFVADQMSAPYDTRWEGPYRADLDPELLDATKKRRIVHQGRVHDIVSMEMIGRYEGIAVLTQSGGLVE
jgi:head-tail adaptor